MSWAIDLAALAATRDEARAEIEEYADDLAYETLARALRWLTMTRRGGASPRPRPI